MVTVLLMVTTIATRHYNQFTIKDSAMVVTIKIQLTNESFRTQNLSVWK